MATYEVTLYYRYKDVQTVEADSIEEARTIAEANAQEEYETYLDAEVIKIGENNANL